MRLLLPVFLSIAFACTAGIVQDARAALAQDDFAGAERLIAAHKQSGGDASENLEAHSWLGRRALALKRIEQAEKYATETRRLVLEALKKRPLDQENHLPIALGASFEVLAHSMAARGERDQGVEFLKEQLKTYYRTSIRTRIQKNIHLLSLEGKPAPAIDVREFIGTPRPQPLTALRGRTVLVFLWAHWCGDCKQQAPIIADVHKEFAAKGLVVIGPTQRYGYVAGGEDATPTVETKYIGDVRNQHYAMLPFMQVPLSEETFKLWGSSTTPTVAIIDAKGVVRTYHPGIMSANELRSAIQSAMR